MASIRAMAGILSMPKVNGKAMVMASTEPRPGKAPTIMPNKVPASIAASVAGSSNVQRAAVSSCTCYILVNQGETGREMLSKCTNVYQVINGNSTATTSNTTGLRKPSSATNSAMNGMEANRKPR